MQVSSPSPSSRRSESEFPFTRSSEDLSESPPYHRFPSSSHLQLEDYPASPAYDPHYVPHIVTKGKEKEHPLATQNSNSPQDSPSTENRPGRPPKPNVHYPSSEVKSAATGFQINSPYQKTDQPSYPSSLTATDDEESSDYDWSGEEDLVDETARFEREQMGVKTQRQRSGIMRMLNFLFSTLIGSAFLSVILITPAILIHFYWYKRNPTEHRRYVKDNVQCWLFWAAANIVISWGLAMIIDLIPVVVRLFISATWAHISESIKTRIELYNSVKDTIKPAFYAGSAWASWAIIFSVIYDLYNNNEPSASRAPYTERLAEVVEFFFFLILIWCVQRMISHFIAFSFHRTAYKERIEDLQDALNVIEKLRDYKPKKSHYKSGTRTPIFGHTFGKSFSGAEHFDTVSAALRNASPPGTWHERSHLRDDGDDSEGEAERTKDKSARSWFRPKRWRKRKSFAAGKVVKGSDEEIEMMSPPNSGPATPSQYSPQRYTQSTRGSTTDFRQTTTSGATTLVQAAKVVKNAVLHDARNIVRNDGIDKDALFWNIGSSREAKRLARTIYMRLRDRRRNHLLASDFYSAFPTHEAAEKAFRVFDKDNNGDISRAELKTTFVKVYKERRFLSRSMRDVGEALKTLNSILLFFAAVIVFFISLSIFGVDVGSSLTSVYTVGIAASFIFKNSASSAFDAIMFLFVTHPYDTGDRCFIDEENLVVKKVGLFATVFARSDGTETYYFNSMLFSKFITNVRRSGKTAENLTMQVAWRTPLEKLDALEKCLNDWLATEENRWFEPSTNIVLQHIKYQRYLELTIGIGHNSNWQDWDGRNTRKTAFHAAVQHYCRELRITGYEAPLPIVYANPDTKSYLPSPPASPAASLAPSEELLSPGHANQEDAVEPEPITTKEIVPSLGFTPPVSSQPSNLTRIRKSRRKNLVLSSMD